MITPELVTYIRGEFAKGKTREEIRGTLMAGGGWSEDDLSEAFRSVIPMQGAEVPAAPKPPVSSPAAPMTSFSPSPVSPAPSPASPAPSLSSIPPGPLPSFSPPTFGGSASPAPVAPLRAFTPPSFSPPTPPQPLRPFNPSPSLSPAPAMAKQAPVSASTPAPKSRSMLKFLIILLVVAGLGFAGWYYSGSAMSLWRSFTDTGESLVTDVQTTPNPDFPPTAVPTQPIIPVPVTPIQEPPVHLTFNSTNNGGIFGNKDDLVSFSVLPGAKVSGQMKFVGSVKNSYFFEGNIGVNILNAHQALLTSGNGTATTDWMTKEPVSFETTLDFTNLAKGLAYIEIRNDDPSDEGTPGKIIKSILIPVIVE